VIGISFGSALTFGFDVEESGLWWGLAVGLTRTAGIGGVLLLRTNWDDQVGVGGQGAHRRWWRWRWWRCGGGGKASSKPSKVDAGDLEAVAVGEAGQSI
jgi:hypothetical protein